MAANDLGVAGLMEKGQLATQRETHLGCWNVARHHYLGREVGLKICHIDAHIPKSWATKEHCNNGEVGQAAKIKADMDWRHKGEQFLAWWAHHTSCHQGSNITHRGLWLRGGLSLGHSAHVPKWAAIEQAKQVRPLWRGRLWLKYKHGEALHITYITLPKTHGGKCYTPTMVERASGWLHRHPVPDTTA